MAEVAEFLRKGQVRVQVPVRAQRRQQNSSHYAQRKLLLRRRDWNLLRADDLDLLRVRVFVLVPSNSDIGELATVTNCPRRERKACPRQDASSAVRQTPSAPRRLGHR
jgi:hypothetical protein